MYRVSLSPPRTFGRIRRDHERRLRLAQRQQRRAAEMLGRSTMMRRRRRVVDALGVVAVELPGGRGGQRHAIVGAEELVVAPARSARARYSGHIHRTECHVRRRGWPTTGRRLQRDERLASDKRRANAGRARMRDGRRFVLVDAVRARPMVRRCSRLRDSRRRRPGRQHDPSWLRRQRRTRQRCGAGGSR